MKTFILFLVTENYLPTPFNATKLHVRIKQNQENQKPFKTSQALKQKPNIILVFHCKFNPFTPWNSLCGS